MSMTTARASFVVILATALATCVVQSAPPAPTAPPPTVTPPSAPTEPPTPPPGDGVIRLGIGSPCDASDQCASGICEGQGCDAGSGRCVPAERMCTMDLREHCGCDGATFQASSTCPGRRYAHAGACAAAATTPGADGAACLAAADCASGVCEGLGCDASAPGVCAPAQRACTRDLRAYCGCDGQTFRTSGSCPGRRYARAGAC
ncbi:MAG: hypothetical protein R2939_07690 [Kofleriaceae bacterium]